jgi:nicotinamide-nucleotide amidase
MAALSPAEEILKRARQKGMRITVAESCTGGLLAAALTEIPGSSDVFDCGFVTYSNAAKREMLGVKAETLARFGAVSEEVAREMSNGALQRAGCDLALAITGIAGPGGSEHKPEGRVCFARAGRRADPISETVEFRAIGRSAVRAASVNHALALLLRDL